LKESLKTREAKEQKPVRGPFLPCGRKSSLGGFDPLGYLPGRNPEGSECLNGLRSWWSHTMMGSDGNAIHSDKFELVTADCRCLKAWKRGITLAGVIEAKSPQSALTTGKAKAAGE
jgi:hypothetical protein